MQCKLFSADLNLIQGMTYHNSHDHRYKNRDDHSNAVAKTSDQLHTGRLSSLTCERIEPVLNKPVGRTSSIFVSLPSQLHLSSSWTWATVFLSTSMARPLHCQMMKLTGCATLTGEYCRTGGEPLLCPLEAGGKP
ncbi:hypothetical protein M758_4G130200 [Ceratodon purpureus]|nr:hypothetical protein M758_4G130200 [Ceratodon purpureus]